ncbi:unnamed protein product [Withania somnifera]
MQAASLSFQLPALHTSSPPHLSFKPKYSLFSYTTTPTPTPLTCTQTLSRKSICKPQALGKYVREDYLVKKLSAKEIQELIKGERTVPLIIDFYATWCGPCILMAQELEMLAVEYENNALIVKVDTDDEYEFARDMQVQPLNHHSALNQNLFLFPYYQHI